MGKCESRRADGGASRRGRSCAREHASTRDRRDHRPPSIEVVGSKSDRHERDGIAEGRNSLHAALFNGLPIPCAELAVANRREQAK
jgi:hypothetical protein